MEDAPQRETKEAKVTPIDVAFPESGDLHLRFAVGACRFRAQPGAGEAWISGTYRDPSGSLPCNVIQNGATVRVTQGRTPADFVGLLSGVPEFDLDLGRAKPYALTLEGGASENSLDLGGLPLNRLTIKHGAGKVVVDFSAANPEPMTTLDLGSGAGSMELLHLANANFAEMRLDGGAAAYECDFGGTLQRDAYVRINTGVSSVEIRVPATTAAKIASESVLGGLDVGEGFMKREGAFWTEAALAGQTPVLTIHASVALGSLRLRIA